MIDPMRRPIRTSSGFFAAIAIGVGLTWAFRAAIELAKPAYWEPVTALDWVAVMTYSVALVLLAPAMIVLIELSGRSRTMKALSAAVGATAVVMAIANFVEDGLGVDAFSRLFVGAALALFAALVVTTLVLATSKPRALALVPLATLFGVGALDAGGGFLVFVAWSTVAAITRIRPAPPALPANGA
jgi:hypothetical protein